MGKQTRKDIEGKKQGHGYGLPDVCMHVSMCKPVHKDRPEASWRTTQLQGSCCTYSVCGEICGVGGKAIPILLGSDEVTIPGTERVLIL